MRNGLDQDKTEGRSSLLVEYAKRHDLCVEFDASEYDQSSFASFSLQQGTYPKFTLIWDARTFVLTDESGYTLARSVRMAEVLAALTGHLETIRAAPNG